MAVNRWNDEMLDQLADSVAALVQAFVQEHEENRQHRQETREWQRQMQEWKRENDLRFNILLEEVRASNHRISRLEDAQNSGSPQYLVISRVYTKSGTGFSPLGENKVYLSIQFQPQTQESQNS
ncbi:hypothetical protein GlitD10_2112 [Gloeomargarita lithophora Alchichica-D10]|uniref:Uncharacterized protein n=1 Tax=Gloeomargarita lithophora Alchichica-D10 TaxID=1188229 RepID=A0A1J0AET2_9CYAN|nr:hypothetical protein [Gloeomargarita lithophora]APB34441.1 hypothetical protein GlitD10_2112 [Gloeomargarita lithophora Alchichica-D10]